MTKKEANPFIPTVVTIVAVICWAIFMLLHILFWSADFDLFQNIVIILLSLVVAGGFIGLMWVVWVFRSGVAPSVTAQPVYHAHIGTARANSF